LPAHYVVMPNRSAFAALLRRYTEPFGFSLSITELY
jgi:hypothetical protein